MITKKEVKKVMGKYGIDFGFPNNLRGGREITIWTDLYHQTKNNAAKLRNLIDSDKTNPFTTRSSIMLATFELIRK